MLFHSMLVRMIMGLCVFRAAFAIDPSRIAIDVVFLLPDRNAVFHFVDDIAAGLERFVAMPAADADPHGDIADAKRARAMHARGFADAEALDGFVDDALSFFDREIDECFVLKTRHVVTFVVVADPAFERTITAASGIGELLAQRIDIDRCG